MHDVGMAFLFRFWIQNRIFFSVYCLPFRISRLEHLYFMLLFDPRSFSLQINRNCGYKWWECYLTWIRPCSPCCKGICIFCFALLILLCHTYIIHTAIYCTALQTMSCENITSVNLRLSFSLLWNLPTLSSYWNVYSLWLS